MLCDHLIRISDMVDRYRDLIGGAMDTHLSMVSNRLNVVMKQLPSSPPSSCRSDTSQGSSG
jgi:Mg2+ and Co2+ transporter CorA